MAKKEVKETSHKKCTCNVWMYISIALGVAFIIALVLALVNTGSSNGIGLDNAKKLSLDIFEKMTGNTATILNAVELSGVYKITLGVQDQNGDIYISKDGKYIFPAAIASDDPRLKGTDTNANTEVKTFALPKTLNEMPKSGKATGITVLEASDYQCPYCGAVFGAPWAEAYKTNPQIAPLFGALKNIEDNFVKTNKVELIHYPVAFLGPESTYASNAALCADEQGKYWEMHNIIFTNQTKEENNGKYLPEKLKEMAKTISGLDLVKFNDCVDSNKYDSKVSELTVDMTNTSKLNTGSFGTPTFYIIVDAAKYSAETIVKALGGSGYKFNLTSDKTNYVIIANPATETLNNVLTALTA